MFYERLMCRICWHKCDIQNLILYFFLIKSIYSIKHKNVLLGVLSYGYPMGMLWLSYGINSQLPYNIRHYI